MTFQTQIKVDKCYFVFRLKTNGSIFSIAADETFNQLFPEWTEPFRSESFPSRIELVDETVQSILYLKITKLTELIYN